MGCCFSMYVRQMSSVFFKDFIVVRRSVSRPQVIGESVRRTETPMLES